MKQLALAAILCTALFACGDREPAAPVSFSAGVCRAVLAWHDGIVDAANEFDDDSPQLSVDGREARYLFAFDEQARITDALRERIVAAPDTGVTDGASIRAALLQAVDDVKANIADQKTDAVDSDLNFPGPRPDRLHAGTEKSLSLMLKPLDEAARDHGVTELGGTCGRRP